MKTYARLAAVACLVAVVACFNINPLAPLVIMEKIFGDWKWDDVVVTWNPNPFNKYGFNSMKKSKAEAIADGFTLREDNCANENSSFRGYRYWKNSDPALTLIYDAHGNIAGIQTSVPKNFQKWEPSDYNKDHPYVDDGDFWTLTAYFAHPSMICRNVPGEFPYTVLPDHALFIQNGTNPISDVHGIPFWESHLTTTKWTKGYCFWTMGQHYWYDVSKDMDCKRFFPFFILYNSGELTGFGFAINEIVLPSPRYEHPGPKEARLFIKPFPDCLAELPSSSKDSTMHVWMIKKPQYRTFC